MNIVTLAGGVGGAKLAQGFTLCHSEPLVTPVRRGKRFFAALRMTPLPSSSTRAMILNGTACTSAPISIR